MVGFQIPNVFDLKGPDLNTEQNSYSDEDKIVAWFSDATDWVPWSGELFWFSQI